MYISAHMLCIWQCQELCANWVAGSERMRLPGNGDVIEGGLQMLHVHVLFVAPLGAGHMAQAGTDQHEGGVTIRETTHHTGAAADLPVEPLNDIVVVSRILRKLVCRLWNE